MRNYNLNVRIARYHNIFGPEGTYDGGREKAPAALCRKVILAPDNSSIEVWGSGQQTRSFLFIDECVEASIRLMRSDFIGPVNIGSEEMVSINGFAKIIIDISGKNINISNISGPVGVNGRNSDNKLIEEKLSWKPSLPLINGLKQTYEWINNQLNRA
jgi:GDP-D-mannose 3', 5'-epimerase